MFSKANGVRAMWMRGGTSKGLYFLAEDLPGDPNKRDEFFLSVMGSPDPRQIDGVGGADPLTSKIAVVAKSGKPNVDLDYHFFQVYVDQALVSDAQACGNIIAGVGPFAVERGLISPTSDETEITIHTINTGQNTGVVLQTPDSEVTYSGAQDIDGVPKPSAPVLLRFGDTAGSMCGSKFPTGNVMDTVQGLDVTMIDDGMPCVLVRAGDLGVDGYEMPEVLEADTKLKATLEDLRLSCGPLMNLGDVAEKTVPKMTLISRAKSDGLINTRSFIPHRCHKTIGVMAAVTLVSACLTKGSVAFDPAAKHEDKQLRTHKIEHPSGSLSVVEKVDKEGRTEWFATPRTARKLMDGTVFAREGV